MSNKITKLMDKRRETYMNTETEKRLISEMELYYGEDKRRIDHAHEVLQFAKEILISEGDDANELVVISAALLHDIGIHTCEERYGSTAGHLQEKEGPPIARHIMEKLHFEEEVINEVCDIIASHHSPGEVDTLNFKILYDADWLVNLEDEVGKKDRGKLETVINKAFLTETGKELAKKSYLIDK